MRKIISLFLLIATVFAFTACKKNNSESVDTSNRAPLFNITVDNDLSKGETWKVINITDNIKVEREDSTDKTYTFSLRGLREGSGLFVIEHDTKEEKLIETKVYNISVDENLNVFGETSEDEIERYRKLNKKAGNAYKKQLEDILANPNEYAEIIEGGSIENCTFAIADVTGDKIAELICSFTEGSMAANKTSVWTYNNDEGKIELYGETSANVQFYKSNFVKCDLSHNEDMGETIWPYTVAAYNKDTKSYEPLLMGWCEDKPEFDDSTSAYDPAKDADGDGVIYYFNALSERENAIPMTFDEYKNATDGIIGENKLIETEYKNITAENIASIAE